MNLINHKKIIYNKGDVAKKSLKKKAPIRVQLGQRRRYNR